MSRTPHDDFKQGARDLDGAENEGRVQVRVGKVARPTLGVFGKGRAKPDAKPE